MATGRTCNVKALRCKSRRAAAIYSHTARHWIAASIVCLQPLAAFAQDRSYEGWGMHPMMGWAWGTGGVVMMIMMLAFWVFIIAGLVVGIRWLIHDGPGRGQARTDAALEILRERYARGEINREEFEAKKRDLT